MIKLRKRRGLWREFEISLLRPNLHVAQTESKACYGLFKPGELGFYAGKRAAPGRGGGQWARRRGGEVTEATCPVTLLTSYANSIASREWLMLLPPSAGSATRFFPFSSARSFRGSFLIAYCDQDAVVEISEHGVVLIVEDTGSLEAKVYLKREVIIAHPLQPNRWKKKPLFQFVYYGLRGLPSINGNFGSCFWSTSTQPGAGLGSGWVWGCLSIASTHFPPLGMPRWLKSDTPVLICSFCWSNLLHFVFFFTFSLLHNDFTVFLRCRCWIVVFFMSVVQQAVHSLLFCAFLEILHRVSIVLRR